MKRLFLSRLPGSQKYFVRLVSTCSFSSQFFAVSPNFLSQFLTPVYIDRALSLERRNPSRFNIRCRALYYRHQYTTHLLTFDPALLFLTHFRLILLSFNFTFLFSEIPNNHSLICSGLLTDTCLGSSLLAVSAPWSLEIFLFLPPSVLVWSDLYCCVPYWLYQSPFPWIVTVTVTPSGSFLSSYLIYHQHASTLNSI